ncbi:MAG TPA: fasciclin domain-containing protein [Allosphingosinicella sp.]|jgi:uncharacterized surface protein with fasciclin (FAS1) repeats
MLRKTIPAALCVLAAACGPGGGNGNNAAAPAAPGANTAAAAQAGKQGGQPQQSILQTLSQSEEHATLANAIKAAGLTETLSGSQPYTLFAPTNAAFDKLPPGTVSAMLAPDAKGRLVGLLTPHIVPGTVTTQDLSRAVERGKGNAQLATVGGTTLTFTRSGDTLLIADGKGEARITRPDMLQSNGVIHSIDTVLAPE